MSEIPNLPPGVHQLSPHLVCDGAADAIDFYVRAFGGEELMRLPGADGRIMHACVVVNGSSVLLVDENREYGMLGPKTLGGSPVVIHLVVPDADATFARAVEAGATVRAPVAEMFWGDRYGVLEDPFGHVWSIATPQRAPMTESELANAAAAAPPA
jgi:uncharacterized glyoxalase superfamily protein PhnB